MRRITLPGWFGSTIAVATIAAALALAVLNPHQLLYQVVGAVCAVITVLKVAAWFGTPMSFDNIKLPKEP